MKKHIYIAFLLLLFSVTGCWRLIYQIRIENVEECKTAILKTEELIKKITTLPLYNQDYHYPRFWFDEDGIRMLYTLINYNPKDSIINGKWNPNEQMNIDTCQTMPGLTTEEWGTLKDNLLVLRENGIKGSQVAFYNDAKFQFFYYDYIYPDVRFEFRDIGFLALLSDEMVSTRDFKYRFKVMDKKEGMYLIKEIW